jgi:hypothetical protein
MTLEPRRPELVELTIEVARGKRPPFAAAIDVHGHNVIDVSGRRRLASPARFRAAQLL